MNETRKVTIKTGVLKNANGSAYIEFGGNKILAGVFGPRDVHPKHMSNPDTGILRVRYHMEPFSVTERKNPAPSRREVEISKVVKEALDPMRDLVCACAAGKAADTLILDVNNEEDQAGQADMPIGYMPNMGQITLLQLDGVLTPDEFKKCIEIGIDGCKQVYEIQKNSLREKYFSSGDNN